MPDPVHQQYPLFDGMSSPLPGPGGARRTGRGQGRRCERLRLSVLGSGSGGNSTVLRFAGRAMLIDAGFGPVTTAKRLGQAGLGLEAIEAICLTHLDRDHFRDTWPAAIIEREIRLYVHHWHLDALHAMAGGAELFAAGCVEPIDHHPFTPMPGVRGSAIRLQHDLQGTLGYRFTAAIPASAGAESGTAIVDSGGWCGSVGYATDLGHAPPALIDHFAGVDVLCLEANYDPHMTVQSARPTFVNRRNMSTSGHLSNLQALTAARQIAAASPIGRPQRVVLLHRSRHCNHPATLRRVFSSDRDLAPRTLLTEQRRRSRWIEARPLPRMQREQLRLIR